MKKFTGPKFRGLMERAGFLKLGLVILAGLMMSIGKAQTSFTSPQIISGNWGSVTNDNTGVTSDGGVPSSAGLPANAPLWYSWTAPQDGEVSLDTFGSVDNLSGQPADTVLGVYTGGGLSALSQVAANDDLYPYSQLNISSGQNIYSIDTNQFSTPPTPVPVPPTLLPSSFVFSYNQPYGGPSGLRFNAKGGTTYYIAVDSKLGTASLVLNWAYKSSGVFRFAAEELDQTGVVNTNNGMPLLLYRTAETETSRRWRGTVDSDQMNETLHTYYPFDVPGVLVTITRVAGSSGRVMVNYTTQDGDTNLITNGDLPAIAGKDYIPISGTLIFDDFEMSKTIHIPIIDDGGGQPNGYQANRDFVIVLTNAVLDPYEDSMAVSPPRMDSDFSMAVVRILDADVDPKSLNLYIVSVDTNSTPAITNYAYTYIPTNAVLNFMKANYRVTRDATNWWNGAQGTQISVLVTRNGTNTGGASVNWIINSSFRSKNNPQRNYQFPLQPGSDYATPDPATIGNIAGSDSDFFISATTGTLNWGDKDFDPKPIQFTVYNNGETSFNEDFKISLYQLDQNNNPIQAGMIAETAVTILANRAPVTATTPSDNRYPAGSVDENYNPDFGLNMVPPVNTIPQQNPNPGTDLQVNGLVVLPDNQTLVVGDFFSYNGVGRNGIALINTNGSLAPQSSFNPGSGVNDAINAVALTPDNRFLIGGAFTSYSGTTRNGIARINRSGSLDNTFNPGLGADGIVWAGGGAAGWQSADGR
ncbi:MAG: Calx-beta domain-containing protein [Limisphaerales bacterium]